MNNSIGKGEKTYPLTIPERQKRINEIRSKALENGYVVATERDTDKPMENRGSIVFETYLGQSNLVNAVDFARKVGGKYGKTVIYKLVPVGEMDEILEAIE